jgi:hypothetical protein
MKTLKLTIVALFISTISIAQTQEAKAAAVQIAEKPVTNSLMKWESDTHDFGDIEKGKPVTFEFSFVNTTKETILLTNVKPSCGCTAANYTKTPIKPGEKGTVEATYNAAAPGNFHKTITVTTNEEGSAPKVLIIKGSVKNESTVKS